MASLYSLSLLALLIVTFVDQTCGSEVKNTNDWFVERNKTPERAFGPQLDAFLRSILENGIPDLNVAPLDPFFYKDNISIGETDMPGMMKIEYLQLGDFGIVGLSNFTNHYLELELLPYPPIVLNLTFPLQVEANYSNFSIIVGDLIPFNGEGPAKLFADLRVEANIVLNKSEEGYVKAEELAGDVFFDSLEVQFSTLMGVTGGKETHIFNKLMGDVTPVLIDVMKPYMMDDILESLRIAANEFFASSEISFEVILNCLMGRPGCPFVIP